MKRNLPVLLAAAIVAATAAVGLGAGLVPVRAEEGIAIPPPALDEAPHAGTATAVLAELAFRALERWGRLAAPGAVTHVLVATALGTALAVLWEYAEFVGNAAVDPRVQVGYRDTMGDLAAGTAQAVA